MNLNILFNIFFFNTNNLFNMNKCILSRFLTNKILYESENTHIFNEKCNTFTYMSLQGRKVDLRFKPNQLIVERLPTRVLPSK